MGFLVIEGTLRTPTIQVASFAIEVHKSFPKNVDDVVSPMKDFFVPRNESTCLYKQALPDVAESKLKILDTQFEMAKHVYWTEYTTQNYVSKQDR